MGEAAEKYNSERRPQAEAYGTRRGEFEKLPQANRVGLDI